MVFGKKLSANAAIAGGNNLNGSYKNDAFVADAATMREIDLSGDTTAMPEKSAVVVNVMDTKRVSFDDALDIIGFGRMQIVVLLVCGTIIMTVLTETMGMGLIMTAAHCDMQLDATRKGILSSVTFIGILLSSQVWGFLADTRGRRRVILYTLLGANACTVISSFATDFVMLVLLRFLAGVLMSAASSVTYAYLGEFNSLRNRSTVIACACIFAGAAYVYIPLMGYLILPGNWSLYISDNLLYRPWRLLVIVNTLPGFLAALCLIGLPESGKFLLTQGLEEPALDVLRSIYRMNSGRPADTFTVHHLLPERTVAVADEKSAKNHSTISGCARQFWQQTVPLFQRPLRMHFLICCFLVFGVFFVSAGIGLWYPEIQNQIARSNSTTDRTVCDVLQGSMRQRAIRQQVADECTDTVLDSTFADTGILGGFYVLVYVVYALCIRRLGVGPFLVAFLFLSGLAGLSLQWIVQPTAVVVLFSSHIVLSGVCISLLTCIVVVLIPTEYRGMAVSISMMFGRVGSIVGSNLVAVLLETNCSATFYLYSGFILVCGLTSLALPIRKL